MLKQRPPEIYIIPKSFRRVDLQLFRDCTVSHTLRLSAIYIAPSAPSMFQLRSRTSKLSLYADNETMKKTELLLNSKCWTWKWNAERCQKLNDDINIQGNNGTMARYVLGWTRVKEILSVGTRIAHFVDITPLERISTLLLKLNV